MTDEGRRPTDPSHQPAREAQTPSVDSRPLRPSCAYPFAIGDPGNAARISPGLRPNSFGVPDCAATICNTSSALVVAASVRGILHRSEQTSGQDAFAVGTFLDEQGREWIAVAVCDGVGSLPDSHIVASYAANRVVELLCAGVSVDEGVRLTNFGCSEVGEGRLEMATTMICARLTIVGGQWKGEACQVGDSDFWHLSSEGSWSCKTGGSATPGGLREWMPKPGLAAKSFRLHLGGGAVFLMSDGVSKPLCRSEEVSGRLAALWRSAPFDPFRFAFQVAFARRGHMDDRTVVGLWPSR